MDCMLRNLNAVGCPLRNNGARVGRQAAMIEVCASTRNHIIPMTVVWKSVSTEPHVSSLASSWKSWILTLACICCCGISINFVVEFVDDLKVVDPYRCGNDTAGSIIVIIHKKRNGVDGGYKKPSRKIPDTCALRTEEMCRVCMTDRGMQTTTTSRIMLIAPMESMNAA